METARVEAFPTASPTALRAPRHGGSARPDFGLAAACSTDLQPTVGAAGGARALMCSILQDAIRCAVGEGRPMQHRARLAHDAREWITRREPEFLFSFDSICSVLGLPTEGLRARILRAAPDLPVLQRKARPTPPAAPAPPQAAVEALLRRGHPLRAVAKMLAVSPARIALAYGELARRVKVERNEEICRLRRAGWTQRALAVRFSLSRMHIIRILAAEADMSPGVALEAAPPAAYAAAAAVSAG